MLEVISVTTKKNVLFTLLILLTIVFYFIVYRQYISLMVVQFISFDSTIQNLMFIIGLVISILLIWFAYTLIFPEYKYPKICISILKVIYVTVLLILFFGGDTTYERTYNFNPLLIFDTSYSMSIYILVFNFLCLAPIVFLFKKINVMHIVLIAFGIEIIQFITMKGAFDICDVILYILGFVITKFIYLRAILILNKKKTI